MGYYIHIEKCDFKIPETPEVLAAIHEMDTKFDDVKRGGSFEKAGRVRKWFSWMPENLTELKTVGEVFERLGFEVEREELSDGSVLVEIIGYDAKAGQEDLFLAVVAPFVSDGSYIEWMGEDSVQTRHIVLNGRLYTQESKTIWQDPSPYRHFFFKTEHFGEEGTRMCLLDPYEPEPAARVQEIA